MERHLLSPSNVASVVRQKKTNRLSLGPGVCLPSRVLVVEEEEEEGISDMTKAPL